jgi:hypothetical protein
MPFRDKFPRHDASFTPSQSRSRFQLLRGRNEFHRHEGTATGKTTSCAGASQMNIAFSIQCYKKLRAKGYKPAAALYAAKFYKSRYPFIK